MNLQLLGIFAYFRRSCKTEEVRLATVNSASPNGCGGADLAIFHILRAGLAAAGMTQETIARDTPFWGMLRGVGGGHPTVRRQSAFPAPTNEFHRVGISNQS